MILPLFDNADIIVECARKSKLDKLERLHEMALRYMPIMKWIERLI